MSESDARTAWARAMAQIAETGDRLTPQMAERGWPVDSGDIYATLLGALSDSYLNQIGVSPTCPSFVPCTGYFQRLGSPNPDTVYRRAPIDPSATYRLTGYRGTATDVTIMPFSQTMKSFTPFDLSEVSEGEDGRFDVTVGLERPDGLVGDWWPLDPDMASLWLREVSDRWGEDEPTRIAITRLDGGSRKRMAPQQTDVILSRIATRVERIVEYGILHADELASEGFINRLKVVDYGASGAMPLQWYHEGIFELGEGEGLLVEVAMPSDCTYFSWSLTDRMLVTLDWMNSHASINSSQASIDQDGGLRVIVSATDPGVPNWLETIGYPIGVLQCRSVGSKEPPVFSASVVPLERVFEFLPPETARVAPGARQEALRKRQIGSQLRRLW